MQECCCVLQVFVWLLSPFQTKATMFPLFFPQSKNCYLVHLTSSDFQVDCEGSTWVQVLSNYRARLLGGGANMPNTLKVHVEAKTQRFYKML